MFWGSGSNFRKCIITSQKVGYKIVIVNVLLILTCGIGVKRVFAQAKFTNIKAGLSEMINGESRWVDYDGDGDLDIVISGWQGKPFTRIYKNEGKGNFNTVNVGIPDTVYGYFDFGDYEGDGDLDMVFSDQTLNNNNLVIYRNDNASGFTKIPLDLIPKTSRAIMVQFGDYDEDGHPDLAVMEQDSSKAYYTLIFHNDGNGNFTQVSKLTGLETGSLKWGDYDGDGDLDIAITGYDISTNKDETIIYRNDSGDFTDIKANIPGVTSYSPDCLQWGDYDDDGDLDLAISGDHNAEYFTKIYKNMGNDTFQAISTGLIGSKDASVGWADYDGDGDPDLLISGYAPDSSYVYRNDAGSYQLTIPPIESMAGDTVEVPVKMKLRNGHPVLSNQMEIKNFNTGFTFLGVDTTGTLSGAQSWSLASNVLNDKVIIWGAGSEPIKNDGTLYKMRFKVLATSGEVPLFVLSSTMNTDSVTNVVDGELRLHPPGDADLNGSIQAYDASLILRSIVGLDTLSSAAKLIGDVDNSGILTSQDATYILQYGVGLIGTLPVPAKSNTTGGADLLVTNTSVQAGSDITVPISWTNGQNLLSLQGKLVYDKRAITVQSVDWGDGPVQSMKSVNNLNKKGTVRLAEAGIKPAKKIGTVAKLHIHINSAFISDSTVIYVKDWMWNGKKVSTGKIVLYNSHTTAIEKPSTQPHKFALNQNYPNPFNPSTNISFSLPKGSDVRLDIFNSLGQKVETLVNSHKAAGEYHILFKANHLSSGIYIYRLRAGNFTKTRKMLLLK